MRLKLLPEEYSICRLPAVDDVPEWAAGTFVSATRTPDELSIVCPACCVPVGVKCESAWRCFQVVGPFQFSEVGVIASLVGPLAEAGIPVFVVSTFETDWLLIQEPFLDRAITTLEEAMHQVKRGSVES